MGGVVTYTLFTLVSYLLIVLHVPFLILPVFVLFVYFLKDNIKKELQNIQLKFTIQNVILLLVFTFGILGQLAVISPSGILKNGDLLFWSAHGHDSTWHIAIMNQIKNGWPFYNPTFAGERLLNYHFFSDVLPAILSKYTPLNDFDSYFRFFPFIYSVFLGTTAYYLVKRITKKFSAAIWAVIFTYFAGSFGYLIGKGESVFWATQPQSSSGNPPQIISDFLVLASLYFLKLFIENKKNKILFFICVIFLGTITVFKVYAGVVLLGALVIVSFWEFIKNKDFSLGLLTITSGIVAFCLYFPNTSGSTSFLIFEPWWYIRTMIVEPSRLNLLDWELRRQTYIFEQNWKRVIFLESLGFIIFFFGNIGMRFIGLWDFVKSLKNSIKDSFLMIVIFTTILSVVLPLLFLQKGVASNTSQFLQYFVLIFGLFAGISTAKLTLKFKILIPLIIVLMIPTQIKLLKEFYSRPAFTKIPSSEIEALTFIKNNTKTDSIILTPAYNQYLDTKEVTPNIWDWFDTSYVSAISSRTTYMDDYEQLDIMGYEYTERLNTKKLIFENLDEEKIKQEVIKTGADIVYFPKILSPKINLSTIGLSKIFSNQETEVWKTNH